MQTSTFLSLKAQLRGVASKILARREDVDDALQDLFVKTWQSDDSAYDEGQRRAYLYTTLRHLCIDRLRTSSHELSTDDQSRIVALAGADRDSEYDDRATRVREIVESRLSGLQRQVFELYVYDELSHDQIARRLGITNEMSRTSLSRARAVMRKYCAQMIEK